MIQITMIVSTLIFMQILLCKVEKLVHLLAATNRNKNEVKEVTRVTTYLVFVDFTPFTS